MVEMFIKYAEERVKELVLQLKDVLGPSHLGEVEYLQFLTNLKVEKSASLDVSIQSSSLPSLLSLADILLSSSIPSSPSEMLPICSFTLMGLSKMTTPTTALVATRLLTSLSSWLLSIIKSTSSSPQLLSMSNMLVKEHSRCFSLLPSRADSGTPNPSWCCTARDFSKESQNPPTKTTPPSADSKYVKSCVSSLAINRREEEERRQAAVEEALAKRMEKLEVVEASSSNTPTAERPSRAIGAPQKRMVPSLGLVDPDTLAKNLEETLSLVKEDNEEQEQQVMMKAVRRGGGRPRLFSAADFFKSKGSSSEVVNTTAYHPPSSTPSVKVSSSSTSSDSKPKSKLPKSDSQPKLSLVKKTSSQSLKENIYEIFEDNLQHTPAPGTRKTTTRTSTRKTSTRKASLADACDSSLVTKSVSTSPDDKLAGAEQPTRSSARRKTALKRL